MQAATRMADGQWPWRDFGWSYGPGEPLVVMALGKAVRPVAAVVAAAAGRRRRDRGAARLRARPRPPARAGRSPAWAAAAVTAAQPTSANPHRPGARVRARAPCSPRPAGARAGRACWPRCAAFWRPDVGAIAALAAAATLLLAERRGAMATRRQLRAAECRPARAAARRGRAGAPLRGRVRPLDVPARRRGRPRRPLRAVRSSPPGRARVWDALVVQATRDGEWWRLPFPRASAAATRRTSSTWLLPFAALVVLVARALRARRARARRARRGRGRLLRLAGGPRARAGAAGRRGGARRRSSRPQARRRGGARAAARWSGAANRASALLRPPDLRAVRRASASRRAEAAALPR